MHNYTSFRCLSQGSKKLIEFADLDKSNCRVYLPLHFSAHARVELAVTQLSRDQYLLTDQGLTVTELKNASHAVGSRVLERMREIIRIWNVDLDGVSLVRMCILLIVGAGAWSFK